MLMIDEQYAYLRGEELRHAAAKAALGAEARRFQRESKRSHSTLTARPNALAGGLSHEVA